MSLLLLAILLIAIYLGYKILTNGFFWRLVLMVGAWFGIFMLLRTYLPTTAAECVVIIGHSFSWAEVIPTVIMLLALAGDER